jgi:hypothetical protein
MTSRLIQFLESGPYYHHLAVVEICSLLVPCGGGFAPGLRVHATAFPKLVLYSTSNSSLKVLGCMYCVFDYS